MLLLGAALATFSFTVPVASANGGCIPGDAAGQVPRQARPGDNVCVSPSVASEVQSENSAAAAGQGYAGGGAYGPKTCVSGLVWREAFDGDAVCVSPQRRNETWQENANAGVGATGGLKPQTNSTASGEHTVTYQVLGAGDVFSAIPDPGTPVYPASNTTWVATPWSQTVQVPGSKFLALNYTDHHGTHDCSILVDGQPVHLTEHKPGRCAYQIP
ncbi:hypothetical protein A5692_04850 [Mycobacterium sp. E342]|uniref:hypothetical protein n=1 Tax=Mycobacterium sp. E342 TaxID=1834147 RepID=UPI0007FC6CF8|nr:hypothetical protein [Mycobacterium sp. E342]OBH24378.1 hypothetical protein A5692_04850 [Mycobacterium sp. E342]